MTETSGPFAAFDDQQERLRIEALRQAVAACVHFDDEDVSSLATKFYKFLSGEVVTPEPEFVGPFAHSDPSTLTREWFQYVQALLELMKASSHV